MMAIDGSVDVILWWNKKLCLNLSRCCWGPFRYAWGTCKWKRLGIFAV
jgi:hypothetical protein